MLKPGMVARSSRSVCVRRGVLRGAITRLLGDDALLLVLLELAVARLSDSKTSTVISHDRSLTTYLTGERLNKLTEGGRELKGYQIFNWGTTQ